jgi:hypothetical protein
MVGVRSIDSSVGFIYREIWLLINSIDKRSYLCWTLEKVTIFKMRGIELEKSPEHNSRRKQINHLELSNYVDARID